MFAGLIFLILGVVFLLRNLEVISVGFWEIFWPAVIILIGLQIIFGRRWWRRRWDWRGTPGHGHRDWHKKCEDIHGELHEKMAEKEGESEEEKRKPQK